LNFLVSAR